MLGFSMRSLVLEFLDVLHCSMNSPDLEALDVFHCSMRSLALEFLPAMVALLIVVSLLQASCNLKLVMLVCE